MISATRRLQTAVQARILSPSVPSTAGIKPPQVVDNMLVDRFQRNHTYLRISLTERCNLRCTYCMPEGGVPLTPSENLLTSTEVQRLARLFVMNGVNKIRLTGGEPTIRRDLVDLVAKLNELRPLGLNSIAMTSNGITLKRQLVALKDAGLDALNVSLDTMDPLQFQIMTRRKGHERVLESIQEALRLGVQSVKLNCVVMRNVNDHECIDFIRLTKDQPLSIRFIEYMPFDGNKWSTKKMVPYQELKHRIEQELGSVLEPCLNDANDTTKHFRLSGYKGTVGFITSMTDHFCASCNRLRITADGSLKVCLFGSSEVSLRDAMREGATDDELKTYIDAAVKKKKFAHAGMSALAASKNRPMILIGLCGTVKTRTKSYAASSQFAGRRMKLRALSSLSCPHPPSSNTPASSSHSSNSAPSTDSTQTTPQTTLSHLDASGNARMVDISSKSETQRTAKAAATIQMHPSTFALLQSNPVTKKGDVLTTAKLAGILAAKQTSHLIPLCHPVALSVAHVEVVLNAERKVVEIECECRCTGRTGVEMEALTAVTVAGLTVYDMCKAVDKDMMVTDIRLVSKSGGRSGDYVRAGEGK